jgi:hypothetical protein
MANDTELQAFSSEEKVQNIAKAFISISNAIHQTLRRLSSNIIISGPLTSYALLTEEYALRA